MFLIRKPEKGQPTCVEVDGYQADISRLGCRRPREPAVWSWDNHSSGRGVCALGRTREEAERLLREHFWGEVA